MKLGFGLYRHMLDEEHFNFARQCGATHIVVHMADYFRGSRKFSRTDQPIGDLQGWGVSEPVIWTVDELLAIRRQIEKHGLIFYAIENFEAAHWHHILFDGPRKLEQMEVVKQIIRNVGEAGIPVFGYNFSLAGVAGRVIGNKARGGRKRWVWRGVMNKQIAHCRAAWHGICWLHLRRRVSGLRPAKNSYGNA